MLAAQNLGLAVFIIVVDVIKEKYGYVYLEFTFLIVLYFTLLAGMYISIHLTMICQELVHLNFHEVDLLNSNSTIPIHLGQQDQCINPSLVPSLAPSQIVSCMYDCPGPN